MAKEAKTAGGREESTRVEAVWLTDSRHRNVMPIGLKIQNGNVDAPDGMNGARILLVDDDPLVRNAVGEILERSGFSVDTHDSGFGLALAIRECEPDLVLLDVTMPGLRGDSALRAVDSLAHNLPPSRIVLFSGIPSEELALKARRLGVASIHKPIAAKQLVARLKEMLSSTSQAV